MSSTYPSTLSTTSDSFTDKISLDFDNDRIPCCISSKQGLRKSDQVSLNCILNFDRKTSLFALYVGHNGAEVAEYASVKFPSLIKNKFYKSGEYDKALMKAYLDFDRSLLEPSVVDEMITTQKLLHEDEFINVTSTSSTEVQGASKNDKNKETEIAETSESDQDTSDNKYVDNAKEKEIEEKEKMEKVGKDSGCTAIIALLIKRKLFVANAGDLRCVVSIDGKAHEMSNDHRPTDVVEFKRICAAGGTVSSNCWVDGKLKFSRALGVHNYKKNRHLSSLDQKITAFPDIRFLDLKSEKADFIVLACDGIWNTFSSQEVVDFISERINKSNVKLSSICEELFDKCLGLQEFFKAYNDNMACIIVTIKPKQNRTYSVEMEKSDVV